MTGRSPRELLQAVAFGFRHLLDGKAANPVQARWQLLAFFSLALVDLMLVRESPCFAAERPYRT